MKMIKAAALGAAATLTLGLGTIIAPVQAHAAGWTSLSRESTGTGRWMAAYSGNQCTGTRTVVREGQAVNANSVRALWFGWSYNSKASGLPRDRIRPRQCHTPLERKFPIKVVLDGAKG